MPAPSISAFGDATHEPGDTGLVVDVSGAGPFPGSLWIFENADGSGDADQLTVGDWTDEQLSGVAIPASPNNSSGTRYLRVQRADLAWSIAFPFTLDASAVPAGGTIALQLSSGALSLVFVRPGDATVSTLNIDGRDSGFDHDAGSAFAFVPRFLDVDGEEYTPSTVHTKVVLRSDGSEIVALDEVPSWSIGDPITAPGAWTDLEDDEATREEHIILVIADDGDDDARNRLRMIVGCLNPER